MKLLVVTQAVDQNDPILGFFHGWLLEFARQCESVEVICLREGKHDLPANVHVHTLGKLHHEESLLIDRLRYAVRFLILIVRLVRQYSWVFVHMNPEYVLLGAPLWLLLRKRVALWYTHKSVTIKLWFALPFVRHVFTASAESFRIKSKKVLVTGHGIDTDLFDVPRTLQKDFLRIITVGRLSSSKRVEALVEAMTFLPRFGIPYRLVIVGDSVTKADIQYKSDLLQKIHDLNIDLWVTFTGAKESKEIPALLASSDVFLHASDTGSLDKAILEAMSERCIVISSNDAARPILSKIHWKLVVEKPEPELFAVAIQKVHTLPEDELLRIREASRAFVVASHSLRRLITSILWTLSQSK